MDYASGYTCGNCGMWVYQLTAPHVCFTNPPTDQSQPISAPQVTYGLDPNTALLERIAEALEALLKVVIDIEGAMK